MRKTLISFAGVLVGLFVLLSLLDLKGDYVVEQMIWRANKKLADASQTPEAIPGKVYEQIADQYRKVIKNFPNSKLTPLSHILLGRVYLTKKDYDVARQKFQEAIKKYPKNLDVCAEGLAQIGSSYEQQGQWPKALESYERIKKQCPLTEIGLNVPIYIARYYELKKDSVDARKAYDDAVVYYTRLANEHPGTGIEFRCLGLLANCYMAQKRWSDVIAVMGESLSKYPNPATAVPLVKAMNTIAVVQLKNGDAVTEIYKNFIEKYPKHPLNKTLEGMIKAFAKLKDKRIEVIPKKE